MRSSIYQQFLEAKQQKKLAILIDPDQMKLAHLDHLIDLLHSVQVDFIMVGGSLILEDQLDRCLNLLKKHTNLPLILFPGSSNQVSAKADAILFLSLISGRNPEYLIGQQVVAAPYIKAAGLEVISTGYMLIDGGRPTTASYMSNSQPIPRNKKEIATCTAIAGEMLGLKTLYLDAGSGADLAVPFEMTKAVASQIEIPLIVGGGIRSPEKAIGHLQAGADIIMVGTGIEQNPSLLGELSDAIFHFTP
ncbi:MAG: geranylgeranylglyceryl/heptaprenylglyceryl phosphate synthase [Bacteroidota bacterium]